MNRRGFFTNLLGAAAFAVATRMCPAALVPVEVVDLSATVTLTSAGGMFTLDCENVHLNPSGVVKAQAWLDECERVVWREAIAGTRFVELPNSPYPVTPPPGIPTLPYGIA